MRRRWSEALALSTAAGQPYELEEVAVYGRRCKGFVHAPPTVTSAHWNTWAAAVRSGRRRQVRGIERTFAKARPGTGWGMTETNAIGTGIGGRDYLERPESSGRCSAVLELRVVDEQGRSSVNSCRRTWRVSKSPGISSCTANPCPGPVPAKYSNASFGKRQSIELARRMHK